MTFIDIFAEEKSSPNDPKNLSLKICPPVLRHPVYIYTMQSRNCKYINRNVELPINFSAVLISFYRAAECQEHTLTCVKQLIILHNRVYILCDYLIIR